MPRSWDAFLTERDRAVAAASGYGGLVGFGERPALLIIDATVRFCGDRPLPILESVRTWRNSCGEEAWAAVAVIRRLLDAARTSGVPVIYTTGAVGPNLAVRSGRMADKNVRRGEDATAVRHGGDEVVAPITPGERDLVVAKNKASGFFGTPLAAMLVDLGVDSLICCGGTTSGCVRATVVDASSFNYRVSVVEDATFDRTQASHAINLFDMAQKYADVVSAEDALRHLAAASGERAAQRLAPLPVPADGRR